MAPMTDLALRTTIHALLDDPDAILVFPTETTARYWTADYAYRSDKGALFLDRVMSWDSFKALFLPIRQEQPSNAMIRNLFAAQFLQSPEGKKLSYVALGTAESNSRFIQQVALTISQLDSFQRLKEADAEAYTRLPALLRKDIEALRDSYRRFLDEQRLYEPLWERPSARYRSNNPQRYVICFPSIIDGYQQFMHDVGSLAGLETALDEFCRQSVDVELFENELVELRVQLNRIEVLLRSGIPCDEIVLTIADSVSWRTRLFEEASIRQVPLMMVQGQSPLDYPAGNVLVKLRSLIGHAFSLDSMKAFFLDPAWPWRHMDTQRQLIRRAVELGVSTGSIETRAFDQWEHKLSFDVNDHVLLDFYRNVKTKLTALTSCTDVESLRRHLYDLFEDLFDFKTWLEQRSLVGEAGEDARILAFCLDTLESLAKAMAVSGIKKVDNLYGFYLGVLKRTIYVPQREGVYIRVYPYRLAAGMYPMHHFILGCSHDATSAIDGVVKMLPETAQDCQSSLKQDASAEVLSCMAASGEHTHLSFGRITFDQDAALVPSSVLEHGSVIEYGRTEEGLGDPFRLEERLWSDFRLPAERATTIQHRWFEQATRTVFNPLVHDFASERAPVDLAGHIRQSDGLFHLSATAVDSYTTCPAQWAATYLFGLGDSPDYVVEALDALKIGSMIHETYERLFKLIAEQGPLESCHASTYVKQAQLCFDQVFSAYARSNEAPLKSTIAWLHKKYMELIPLVIEAELGWLEGTTPTGFELPFSQAYPESGYLLKGRIDKVVDLGGINRCAVVDYKKSFRGTRKEYEDPNGNGGSTQLPMYAKVLQDMHPGLHVEKAAYYDVQAAKHSFIWTEQNMGNKQRLLQILEDKLDDTVRGLAQADFTARPSRENCKNCPYRQICRRRYVLQ